jgi:chromate transporter
MLARVSPAAVFRLALLYGVTGFGGGYSVLAQLRRDLVERKKWLTGDDFLVLAELSKSLPGTPATSLITLLGQRVAGVRAGMIAAGAFLLPSAMLMVACGAAYPLLRRVTELSVFFDGMNAAMVGVVGAVTVDLGRSALRSWRDVALAALSCILLATRVISEPIVAAGAVAAGAVRALSAPKQQRPAASVPSDHPPPSERLHAMAPIVTAPLLFSGGFATLAALARVFVPIGVMTFGGGLAMIPAIEHLVVIQRGWLDSKAFADAIALGQITPGPVAICATFIGYRVAGGLGAVVATAAMFVPATALTLIAGHSVERFRTSRLVEGALRMLAPVVIGMLGAATFSLAKASFGVHIDVVLAIIAFALLMVRPLGPLWLLMGGGLVRLAVHLSVLS